MILKFPVENALASYFTFVHEVFYTTRTNVPDIKINIVNILINFVIPLKLDVNWFNW